MFFLSRYVARVDGYYFEGTGYGKVPITKFTPTLVIYISVLTRLTNGLLFCIGSEVNYPAYFFPKHIVFLCINYRYNVPKFDDISSPIQDNYVTLTMEKGFLVVRSNSIQVPTTSDIKLFPVRSFYDEHNDK